MSVAVAVEAPPVSTPSTARTLWRSLGLSGRVALVVLVALILLAVFGPMLAPHDPAEINLSLAYGGVSSANPLGLDDQGRDLLSRLMTASRVSILGPLLIVVVATVFGTALALASAWRSGWIDGAVGAALDVLFALPAILLAILAIAMFGKGFWAAEVALSLAYLPYLARIVRGAALRELTLPYVEALYVQGLSGWRICVRHILPNLAPLIAGQAALAFGYAMVDLAALSFLGLGLQDPQVDWGGMVGAGKNSVIEGYPAQSLLAGACIVVTVLAVNVLSDRLQPTRRSRWSRS